MRILFLLFIHLFSIQINAKEIIDTLYDEGSFNGYFTNSETIEYFKAVAIRYPDIAKFSSIGKSFESRDIVSLSLSLTSNPTNTIILASMLRPKEVIGMTTIIASIQDIILNYQRDVLLQATLSSTAFVFVPVINPDGYEKLVTQFNATSTEPLSLKNNANTCPSDPSKSGVNLGHNWATAFNFDIDSEEDSIVVPYRSPCGTSYQGPSAFSEPETQAMRDLILKLKPSLVLFFHQRAGSADSRIIYPYTSQKEPLKSILKDDFNVFIGIIKIMNDKAPTQIRGPNTKRPKQDYYSGSAIEIMSHTITGSEIDWTFEEGNAFSLIIQVGSQSHLPLKHEIKLSIQQVIEFTKRLIK